MSPASADLPGSPTTARLSIAIALDLGRRIKAARQAKGWTLRELGGRVGLSASAVLAAEGGRLASVETYVRLGVGLGLTPSFELLERKRPAPSRAMDPVHAAMTEAIATKLSSHRFEVGVDEPYQHFQFAGRADLVAWDREARAFLHCEQRTRLDDVQAVAGAFNAKRNYLAPILAQRLGIQGGFRSVSHVLVLLWSAEILHPLRLRTSSMVALAPDGDAPFGAWWQGHPPERGGSGLVVFDPLPGGRSDRRRWIDLDTAASGVRPRYRGYADALAVLRRSGMA